MAKTIQKTIDAARAYEKRVYDGISRRFWWEYVKPAVHSRDTNCVRCGGTENLDVHHKNYSDTLTLNDLELLCRSCHKTGHTRKDTANGDDENG